MIGSRLFAPVSKRDGRAVFLFALFAYALFSLFDWVTSAVALGAGGAEGNPIAASVFSSFGDAGLLVFKVVVVAVIMTVLTRIPRRIMSLRVATWVAATFAVVSAITVVHNVAAYASLIHEPEGPTYHATAVSARLL